MLNPAEHESFPANKSQITNNFKFFFAKYNWAYIYVYFFSLQNLKSLTFSNSFLLNIAEHEAFSAKRYENANYCWHFHIY